MTQNTHSTETSLAKKRILTGDNPTGKLHLGHFVGSLENRVQLQNDYEMFIIIPDMHAFAYPKYVSSPQAVAEGVLNVTIGNLAVGLDPQKTSFVLESAIPEIYELGIIFSMLISHARELRNPTLKEEIRDKGMGDNYSMGFVNFPLLQVADIIGVDADLVPVGEDQLPHLELTNEVVRKFNATYPSKEPVFKEIAFKVGRVKRLIGTDGNAKMSKSIGNTIYLGEDDATLKEKVMKMYTDPSRVHPTDPGKVEGNPVFIYHDAFNRDVAEVEDLKSRYAQGKVGDVEVKTKLYTALSTFISPIREKHVYYESHLDEVRDIISTGTKKAREIYQHKLLQAKEAMKLYNI